MVVDVMLAERVKGICDDVFLDSGRETDVGCSINGGDFDGIDTDSLGVAFGKIDDAKWGASDLRASSSCSLSLLTDKWYNEDTKGSTGSTGDGDDAAAASLFCPMTRDNEKDVTSEVASGCSGAGAGIDTI